MTNFNILRSKIDYFKTIATENSITPLSLGSILSDLLDLLIGGDTTDIRQELPLIRERINSLSNTVLSQTASISELGAEYEQLTARIDALLGDNASTAIDNFNEVIDFLSGLTDDAKLAAILDQLRQSIAAEVTARESAVGALAMRVSTTESVTSEHGRAIEDLSESVYDHYRHVGIVAFDAIVDHHDLVLAEWEGFDGEDGEEGQNLAGLLQHVVFDKSRGRFLFEMHDETYDCPGGDAFELWPRASEFYSEDGMVRADQLYRCGNRLYKYIPGADDESVGILVEYVDERKLKKATDAINHAHDDIEQLVDNLADSIENIIGQSDGIKKRKKRPFTGPYLLTRGQFRITSEPGHIYRNNGRLRCRFPKGESEIDLSFLPVWMRSPLTIKYAQDGDEEIKGLTVDGSVVRRSFVQDEDLLMDRTYNRVFDIAIGRDWGYISRQEDGGFKLHQTSLYVIDPELPAPVVKEGIYKVEDNKILNLFRQLFRDNHLLEVQYRSVKRKRERIRTEDGRGYGPNYYVETTEKRVRKWSRVDMCDKEDINQRVFRLRYVSRKRKSHWVYLTVRRCVIKDLYTFCVEIKQL